MSVVITVFKFVFLSAVALANGPQIFYFINKNKCTKGSQSFSYSATNAPQTFTLPAGACTPITIKAWGAGGGSAVGSGSSDMNYTGSMSERKRSSGGGGAFARATYSATPGETLYIVVGAGGAVGSRDQATPAAGGYPGGGNGVSHKYNDWDTVGPGAGGGYSGVFVSSTLTQANARLIAGGGGGGGARGNGNTTLERVIGGGGGGTTGEDAASGFTGVGKGGTTSAGGAGGVGTGKTGTTGSALTGGNGNGGGGGGGGYFGGGGGAYQEVMFQSDGPFALGGGGGSSYGGGTGISNFSSEKGTGRTAGGSSDPNYDTLTAEGGYNGGGAFAPSPGRNGRVLITW